MLNDTLKVANLKRIIKVELQNLQINVKGRIFILFLIFIWSKLFCATRTLFCDEKVLYTLNRTQLELLKDDNIKMILRVTITEAL
jgi:hypothetical protein